MATLCPVRSTPTAAIDNRQGGRRVALQLSIFQTLIVRDCVCGLEGLADRWNEGDREREW